jgi:hypothetical protein
MAQKKRTEPVQTVTVKPDKNISLTVVIGNAQIGSSVVKFKGDDEILEKGVIKNLALGKGEEIVGRTLRVVTRVLDSNSSTNKIVVTHKLENGTPKTFEYEDDVAANQDVFTLVTDYKFV